MKASGPIFSARIFSAVADSKAHLAAVGESYFEHMRFAAAVGAMLAAAAMACTLHALIPGVCTGTASRTIRRLNILLERRETLHELASSSGEAIGFAFLASASLLAVAALWIIGTNPAVALPLTFVALGLPGAFLLTNPELEAAPEAPPHA
jgi:hypothetical protein